MEELRYPIGQFKAVYPVADEEREASIAQIPQLTVDLGHMLEPLPAEQMKKTYRPGGWSIRQIVHHLADNDMNAYIRFKRALTEEEPLAGSYREDRFAELPDYGRLPISDSLQLMKVLHARFHILLERLEPADFARKLQTQAMGAVTLDAALQRFIWHHRHHRGHIALAIRQSGEPTQ